jgi:hypothetical protein
MNEINSKFENLKSDYLKTLSEIEEIPVSSINDISKIIHKNIMELGRKTLQTWIDTKTESKNKIKKNL